MIKKSYILVPFFLIVGLSIGFFFKIDPAGGSYKDFISVWKYIIELNSDFSVLYNKKLGVDNTLLHYPLHYLLVSRFDIFIQNKEFFLKTFFIISIFLPFIFYKCLAIKFQNVEKKYLVFLASLIYLFPAYQSAAIWGNSHITALYFLLFSIFFYLKWEKEKKNSLNINIILQVTFLALAAYTRQYYVILFPFFFLRYIKYLKIKNFIYLSLFTILLSIPGIIFLKLNPMLLWFDSNTTNFLSSILVVSSILCFNLIPFLLILLLTNIQFVRKKFFNNLTIFNLFLSIIIVVILSQNFIYIDNTGGGIFLKLSRYIFKNEIFFFLSSALGIFFLLSIINNKIENLLLVFILLLSFSSGFYIFHKYFEPMFLIILFCLFDKEITENFLKNKIFLAYIYFATYLCAAIIQSQYNIIKF